MISSPHDCGQTYKISQQCVLIPQNTNEPLYCVSNMKPECMFFGRDCLMVRNGGDE